MRFRKKSAVRRILPFHRTRGRMKNVSIKAMFLLIAWSCLVSPNLDAKPVNSYYGTYDVASKRVGVPAVSLKGPTLEAWKPARPAAKGYTVAILVPQLVDTWLAFSYGAISTAEKLGVQTKLYSAKGYLRFGDQRHHLKSQINKQVDGVILGSISYRKMDRTVSQVTGSGMPVVAFANDIHAPTISGKSLVSFVEMGYVAGQFVLTNLEEKPIRVAFFPGPKGAGWSGDSLKGFRQALENSPHKNNVSVISVEWGDTREIMQQRLVDFTLRNHTKVDFVVGNAVAANYAANALDEYKSDHPHLKVVSTYINPGVYASIQKKKIMAAACDFPVRQGQLAMEMMVRIIQGEKAGLAELPFRVGPQIEIVTQANIAGFAFESIFGKNDFKPDVE